MEIWQEFIWLTEQKYFAPLLNLANIILIFLTTVIMYKSMRASSKANELNLLPMIAVYFRGNQLRDRKIRIRNIGKSPAYNIQIESLTHIFTDVHLFWKLEFFIKGTNVLVPDEEQDLFLKTTENGRPTTTSDFMIFSLDPEEEHRRKRIGLIMTFKNAEGNIYYSKVETGVGGLFIKPSKKLGIYGRLYIRKRKTEEYLFISSYKVRWKIKKILKNKSK